MRVNGVTVTGASASGVSTCLVVHPYKVVLDIGHCSKEAMSYQTVLVTHAHIDHMGGAVQHAASRSLQGHSPSRFICNPEVGDHLEALLTLWNEIQGGFKYEIVRLAPGDAPVYVSKGLTVSAFHTAHRVPSQGYVLYETRSKLRAEYVGMLGVEIGALRKSGVEVSDKVVTPVLAYTGDTLPEALAHPDVQRAKFLIAECTFVNGEAPVPHARKHGHTHLDELAPMLEKMTFEHVLLVHFSLRHSRRDIEKAVAKLPASVRDRMSLLLDGDGPVREW